MGVLLSKKKNEKRQSFQVSAAPQDEDQTREEAAGPSDREDPSGKRRNEDDVSESQKSSEDEREPKSDDDDSENEEKDESKSDQEESASEDNEDKKNRSSSSASSKESKSSQEDEEKREGVDEEKDEEVEVKEGSVKDVVSAQTEVNLSYEKKLEKALVGDMDFEYPEKAKIVRIFTSSTFTDTSVERNTLMERVYPRLKSFCQERGYDFQVVDMRWGVRDESTDDHMTTELCMRELRACQKLSTGPNFIVSLIRSEMQNPLYAAGDYPRSTSHMFAFLQTFLGQKYGYRPFPVKIHVTEFEKLLSAVDNQDDVALLKHWFWRDDNSVPAQYLLQPITSLLPHYRDYANEESRKKASAEWWTAFERMQVVLRAAADKALKNESERHKYYMSVTEDEIRRGIIDATGRDKHCFWFKRVITDIGDFVAHPNAGKFVDKTWGNPSSVDESAQTLLANLREKDLPEALSNNSIIHYDVKWHTNGIDPSASQEHRQYIEKLCTDFYDTLTDRIERGIAEDQLTHTEDLLIEEVFQHGSFCRKKCEMFQGRDEFLTEVKDTILQKRIAVLHGESGCGKTSLMAKIAMDVKKWLGGESATVVTRFIGTTPDSSNARSLLHSICQQISKANVDSQGATVPQDMKSLLEFFPTCLKENASSKPIILVLDSLDQLSDDDGGREVDWVPKEIPKNVYMILSTLPGEKYICFPKLQEKYEASVLLEVPKMPVDTAKQILNNWFKSSGRQLQSEQEKIVLEAFEKCPLPLYLKLCFDEACRWKSYTTPSDTKLTPSIKGIIHDLLDRVERLHGKILVSQALAYITASRNGLTEPELEDILSLDDVVLNDVYQYWTPPIRRLPPLLWIRIRSDIGDYLIERGADGARVINWYHRQFTEVARERYLGDEQAAVGIHSNMSEYFLGDWSDGVKKSYVDKEGKKMAVDRLVPKQPLMFDVSEEKPIFNLRKLSEVPHHLLHSKQIDKLKQDTLCNFEFLLAKVQGSSVEAVQQDFNAALTLHPDDREFDLLQKCFSLSAHALRQDPRQLSVQLIGRLYKYMQKQECPFLKKVLIAAHTPSVPAFIPNQQCLTPAGGSLINSISNEEFHGGIEHVNFTRDSKTIVTCNRGSEGLCLLYVDVKSGRRQRKVCFDSSDTDVNTCWCAKISKKNDDIFIASGSSANMYLINARANKILQEYKPMKDQGNWFQGFPSVAFAEDDKLIVALGDSGVRIWETASGKLLHDVNVKGINVEEEFGSLDANGGLAVYCVRNTKTVHVLNVKTGEEVRTINVALDKEEIRGEMQDTKVKEIHLTSRKQLLVVSEASVKSQLKVYNAETGEYVLDLKEFGIGYNNRLIVTEDGKNAIAIRNNYELVKWEIHTGEPTIVARLQPAFGTYGRNGDVVATAGSDGVLRVYDTRENVDEDETDVTATTAGFADSIWTLTVAVDNRHVIASCTVKMMPEIAVWDALAGVKVRSIKAMNFPQPLHMIDDKVGVGRMAVGEATKDHFDHFKLLDFGQAKTTRVLQGKASKRLNAVGFIDKKNFMGLSRGRRNLKVWNVDTGKVVGQYKLGQKYRLEGILICKDGGTVICSQASFYVEQEDQTVPLLVFNTKTHGHKTMEPIKDEQLGLDGSAITEDGKYFILQLKNDQVSAIWNTETGKLMHTLEEGSSGRNMVAISSKSMLALTSHESLKVWEIQTGKLVHDLFATDIDKIYLNEEGTIAITTDSKGYQPPSFEAWDLIKGKKLASYTVDTNPSAICPLGDHIVFAAPASVTVTTLRLHIPGSEEKKPALSSYGDHVELSEFKGMMGPCDPNDDDDDEDDDDGDIQ